MKRLFYLLLLLTVLPASGQGTIDDYRRAYSLRQKYTAPDKVYYSNIRPNWIGDTHKFWYFEHGPKADRYMLVDADKRNSGELFNHIKLARSLARQVDEEVSADRLGISYLSVTDKIDTLRFRYKDNLWEYDIKRDRLTRKPLPAPGPKPPHWMVVDEEKTGEPALSPDGKYTAYIRENNLWVRDNATGRERQLSRDGAPGHYYSSRLYWSPDSRKIAVNKIRPAEKRYVQYVESSPSTQLQPITHTQEYAKPGDELRQLTPCIFYADTTIALQPERTLFENQYDLWGPIWSDRSDNIVFEYNQRGHKVYRMLEMSAIDGSVRPLVEETHDKYVNYPRIYRHLLGDGRRFIWSSERDNYNHLYLYDRETAQPINQITSGEWYVRSVVNVDEEKERIIFTANGVNKDEDPYLIRYYSINFDGSDMRDLTPAEGMHDAWFSADRKYLVDRWSMADMPEEVVLRSAETGEQLIGIAKADISGLLAEGWSAPEVFKAPGRDGKTDMWGIIMRPSNFDPTKKYPVVEYIYQGPGDQYVPKKFIAYNNNMTALAELGFIVVMVDGMSTSFRSREFENICYKNLKDAALPDHMAWLRAAAEKYPYMDIDRVGIFGASAGGQESTNAVLLYPEFYKAAYSSCGCHDNRMDKIWWNELWMGYPIDEAYEECSNVVNAHKLERPLMLVVGELDDNVDPASTMQVADALIKAGKDFELVVIPGAHHTMGESFGEHKRFDFFVRHLHGVNPPAWSELK